MTNDIKDIILVDDHVIIREGLKELIEKLGAYKVSRQYSDGDDLVKDLPLVPTPDLVIMDISMTVMDGDKVVAIMREKEIDIPILILTLSQDENKIVRLFRNGVCGYLTKDCTAAMMKQALEEIFRVGYYHNELMVYALQHSDGKPKKTMQESILEKLSAREKDFLKLICHEDEYTYDQIASRMNVQHRTVDGYRQSIFEKFGIKSKTGLVLFMLKHQLYEHLG